MLFNNVAALLNDPRRWTTKTYAKDGRDRSCSAYDSTAVCWCLMGAIMVVYKERAGDVAMRVEQEVGNIGRWNDTVTHSEVVALCRRLGI